MILALVNLIGGFLIGLAVGAKAVLRSIARERRPQNTDYKERWLRAVNLLAQEGKITQKQLDRIRDDPPVPDPVSDAVPAPASLPLRTLRGMATWDRREVEMERARAGLPPADDLAGMATWDVREVLKARARYGNAGRGNP